jgi:CBS domain containing-hemolysin-like protein
VVANDNQENTLKKLRQILKNFVVKRRAFTSELSEEDLRQVLDAGSRSGVLDKTEHELIKSIFEFTDTTAKEIMVPRPDVVALDIDAPRDQLIHRVIEEGYSRLPVYRESIDNIIGVIYSKDLLSLLEHRSLIILQDIIRPAYFVHESKKISELLREFQQRKLHLAVVVDEFGGTEGIVTMEDIVEEIVGEIHDEYDEVLQEVSRASDGSATVDAKISISDFNAQFGASIPDDQDYKTLGGYLQKVTGRYPEVNEELKAGGFEFKVLSKTSRRIRQMRVRPLGSKPTGSESQK